MTRLLLMITALALAFGLTAAPEAAVAKENNARHCPPGLAKKTPACVPPGLANKGVRHDDDRYDDDRYEREDERDDDYGDRYDRIRVGDRVVLNGDDYTVVKADGDRIVLRREDTLYRLPRIGDGSDYVRMGDVIVRVDRKTKAALQIIQLVDLILS
jgi:hypothetical protein